MKPSKDRKSRDDGHGASADASPALLREFDAGRRLVACNAAWCAFTGRTAADETGRDWSEHLHPDDRERCEAALAKASARGAPYIVECRLQRHDGTYRHVIDSGIPHAGGYASSALDLGALDAETAAAGLPDPLLQQQQLRDVERSKDEFIAAIAHELRNPLTPILNALQLLRTPRVPDADVQSAREMIERQSRHLVRLVDDLLEVSRGKQGRVILRRERVDLCQVARSAVDAARTLLAEAGHRCSVDLPQQGLWIDADASRLGQALGNLIQHAARHTPRGGSIELHGRAAGEEVLLELVDTGSGIAPELLPRIFEPFLQAHGRGSSPAGLGLGLALAKQLVDLHGGTLVAYSDGVGKGSRFVLKLPLKVAPSADARSPRGVRQVLVVDDNRDAARIMSLVLTTMGHEVRTAYDGYSALEVAQSFKPDAVLLDLGLPQLDGCSVAERLRREPHGKDLLLIALTGWGQDADRLRTRAAGFDHHLVKPVDTEMLRRLLGSSPAQAA